VKQPAPVGIVGGGIMGVTLAYFLARKGIPCDVFEASPVLGGLAGPLVLDDGTEVDRFYHAILSSDAHLRSLCEELGIADQLRFRETRTAFYIDGGLHSMNSLVEFLAFKPLSLMGRIRLGLTVAAAQFYRDWHRLEAIEISEWLCWLGGRRVYDRLWKPMLVAKFDGDPSGVPATWMWARLVRMKSTRDGANQRERAGHLIGGYASLLRAMAGRIEDAGGTINLRQAVNEVVVEDGRVTGLCVCAGFRPYGDVVITTQGPLAARLVPRADPEWRSNLERIPYLGIVCPLLVLDRPLSGTWTVNIADPSIPFTGVIETTSYIDPVFVGGHHLVYLPKYTAPGSRWLSASDEEVRTVWLGALHRMFPAFDDRWVRYFLVHRERYVEPLRRVASSGMVPGFRTAVRGLHLATTAQIYPQLTNGESVTRHAAAAAQVVREGRAQEEAVRSARARTRFPVAARPAG
jgi:protoporphyrinogen oxidase